MMKNEHYRQSLEHSHEIYLPYDLSACYKTSRYLSCLGNLSIGGLSIEHGLQNGLQLVIRFSLQFKLYKTFYLQIYHINFGIIFFVKDSSTFSEGEPLVFFFLLCYCS